MKNRKIKVRVWSKPLERFLTKDERLLDFDGDLHFIDYDEDSNQYWPDRVPEENYVVQQYTGLKDSKGKEISEGDIVKYNINYNESLGGQVCNGVSVISFENGSFMIDGDFLDKDWAIEHIVIGNIFENPEQLKV